MNSIIEINNLKKIYSNGKHALNGININIGQIANNDLKAELDKAIINKERSSK